MICPADIDDEEWTAAVGGLLLGLKLLHPGMPCPLFLLGVNQHAEQDSNSALRRILLQKVVHVNTLALACGA